MYLWIVGAVLVLGGLVYSYIGSHPTGIIDGSHEGDVRTTVAQFGNQLNSVSPLSPAAAEEIRSSYGPYVSPELLSLWMQDPSTAPGRRTSSPWPDHIEVDTVLKNEAGSYDVMGRIILKTSTEDAGIVPVSLTVANVNGSFLITRYEENPRAEEEVATSVTVTTALNESVSALGVSITPLSVEEDSRCPMDVQCIQAGQVRLKVMTIDGMGTSTMTITLGATEPITTETVSLWLMDVLPIKVSTNSTEDTEYRFTFRIDRR
ncbi:MAG: hypothetical protein QG636_179 [Patescibacteria group bacterium]|nr:hypothetical protein [Patescibacteria group bacterium]